MIKKTHKNAVVGTRGTYVPLSIVLPGRLPWYVRLFRKLRRF